MRSGKMLAFHIDLKRPMWSADFMTRYAATLRDWGYNTILYEVEDKLRYTRHPDLAHADALSADETRSRLDALRALGMEIVPLVQTLGHAEYVLAKPGYSRFRESPSHFAQYDPLSEDVRAFIIELIDETAEAVRPARFFHLGGDETWELGQSEACQPIVAKIGKGGLYARHMLPLVEHVIAQGLRPILWADIALTHPEIVDRFPRELVWMDWDYWTAADRVNQLHVWGVGRFDWKAYQEARQEGRIAPEFVRDIEPYAVDDRTAVDGTFVGFPYTRALRELGFDVITAPATRCYGDAMGIPLNRIHLPNCFAAARTGREYGLGACVTSWTVRHSHPLVNLPGAFAAARGFGSTDPFDRSALLQSFSESRFGVALPTLAEALDHAEARVPWCEAHALKPPDQAARAVTEWIGKLDSQSDGRGDAIRHTEDAIAGLARAEALLRELRRCAIRHAEEIDYWIEGVAHTAFCGAFSRALLQDRPRHEAPALRRRLDTLRAETRRLFAATYPAVGVGEELAMRYAFHEAVLSSALL